MTDTLLQDVANAGYRLVRAQDFNNGKAGGDIRYVLITQESKDFHGGLLFETIEGVRQWISRRIAA